MNQLPAVVAVLAAAAALLGSVGGIGGAALLVPVLVALGAEPTAAAPVGLVVVAAGSLAASARQLDDGTVHHRLGLTLELAAAGGVALLGSICRSLSEITNEAQSQLVTDTVYDALHAQSVAVDLEYYEDPRYHDTLHRAQQEAPFRPTRIVSGLLQIIQNGVSLVGVVGLLAQSDWKLALLLVVAGCSTSSGSRDYIPGKGWVPND